MIPRIKVNYNLRELLNSLIVFESSNFKRQALIKSLSQLFETDHVLLTASGRGGLYALLSCLPQKFIVVPAYTCKAVIEAAILAGKTPIFVETEDDGFNMSPHFLENILNSDTILLVTHQFGIPCNINTLLSIARKAGTFVIEDAAASLGSKVDGQLTGNFGDAAFFSFDTTKLLNVPLKAGFVVIHNSALYKHCAAFLDEHSRSMPISRKLKYLVLGCLLVLLESHLLYRAFHSFKFKWRGNFTDDSISRPPILGPFYIDRLAEWQAGIILPQLESMDKIIDTRRRLYSEYIDKLATVKTIFLPPLDLNNDWAPIRFPIRVPKDKMQFYHESVSRGVDYSFSFTFIDSPKDFSISHRLAETVLGLPFYYRLSSSELEHVVEVVKELDLIMQMEQK